MDFKPYPKSTQLARGERRHARQVASKRRWAEIAQGEAGAVPLLPDGAAEPVASSDRSFAGRIGHQANIVPLCLDCHAKIEDRHRDAGHILACSLSDMEYAYVVEKYGEAFFERRLGIVYERA